MLHFKKRYFFSHAEIEKVYPGKADDDNKGVNNDGESSIVSKPEKNIEDQWWNHKKEENGRDLSKKTEASEDKVNAGKI